MASGLDFVAGIVILIMIWGPMAAGAAHLAG